MNDRDTLKEIFTRAGFKPEENPFPNTFEIHEGYHGFYTMFEFDASGTLIKMGAFE